MALYSPMRSAPDALWRGRKPISSMLVRKKDGHAFTSVREQNLYGLALPLCVTVVVLAEANHLVFLLVTEGGSHSYSR